MTDVVRCLILEKDELTIKTYQDSIYTSWEICFISDELALLNKIASFSPSVIILNLQYIAKTLPLIHTIKKISSSIFIIAVTNTPILEEAISLIKNGVSDYLTLPLKKEDFLVSLLQILKDNQKNNWSPDIEQQNKLAFLGELAAEVAHDIKTPLSCMVGFITLYLKLLKKNDVKVEELKNVQHYLDQSISEAKRCKKILDNLLMFSRKENFSFFNLLILLERIHFLVKDDLKESHVELILNVDKELMIYGSEDKLHQVFLNLIVNAKNAIYKGKIVVGAKLLQNGVRITIEDNGKGIEQDDLDKIFVAFYTKTENGNGLGLSIAKKIVEEHNGKIFATSEIDKGSTFTIELPKP